MKSHASTDRDALQSDTSQYDATLVGSRMRIRREKMRLTQAQAAEEIGRSLRFYADIERGTTGMSVGTLLAICRVFAMTPDELLLDDAPNMTNTRVTQVMRMLDACPLEQQARAVEMLELFLKPMP